MIGAATAARPSKNNGLRNDIDFTEVEGSGLATPILPRNCRWQTKDFGIGLSRKADFLYTHQIKIRLLLSHPSHNLLIETFVRQQFQHIKMIETVAGSTAVHECH